MNSFGAIPFDLEKCGINFGPDQVLHHRARNDLELGRRNEAIHLVAQVTRGQEGRFGEGSGNNHNALDAH